MDPLEPGTYPLRVTFLTARDLWLWLSAITIIVPTFIALTQSDARLLLAWHGIGQSGYMLMGVVAGKIEGFEAVSMYMAIYVIMNMGAFAVVAQMSESEDEPHLISSFAGQGFMNLALASAGRLKAGAAKVSVLASSLFGSISGSASANVASTGSFTLPAMKRLGEMGLIEYERRDHVRLTPQGAAAARRSARGQ